MADIIPLESKREISDEKKKDLIRKRKISAVQKVFQCTHCALKCEKCGSQLSHHENETRNTRVPYKFCENCSEEYMDYIERLKGGGDKSCYWRNEIWLDLWRTWINYQSSLDRYYRSKEFVRLLKELKEPVND